jgi:dihydroorotase
MSENPAKIFGIKDRGFIKTGGYADLAIVDLSQEWHVDPAQFYTKAKYSPFSGMQLKGRVIKTFVNGKMVYDNGKFFDKKGKEVEFT